MNENLINQINALPYIDKANLRDYLIEQTAEEEAKFGPSEEVKKMLDEDYKEYLANPERGISWEEAKAKILRDNGM